VTGINFISTELIGGSWEAALELFDNYPWASFYPLRVHPDFAERIWLAVQDRCGRRRGYRRGSAGPLATSMQPVDIRSAHKHQASSLHTFCCASHEPGPNRPFEEPVAPATG
jgi:hypothetical protein